MMSKYLNDIDSKIAEYNTELNGEGRVTELNRIKQELDGICKEARKAEMSATFTNLMTFENPMLEAARQYQVECPSYQEVKKDGVVEKLESTTKMVAINPVELTQLCQKYSCEKDDPHAKTGVFKSGMAWTYHVETLGLMFTLSLSHELGQQKEVYESIRNSYLISKNAAKITTDKIPELTTTTFIKSLQEIVDLLLFIPNDKGLNTIKIINKDINYLKNVLTSRGKAPGAVKVITKQQMMGRIFEMLHMIVCGLPYTIEYKAVKNDINEYAKHLAELAVAEEKAATRKVAPSAKTSKAKKSEPKAETPAESPAA